MKNNYELKPYAINSNGADMTLELLSNKLDSGDIEIPEFQRSHVWQVTKASKLIESFLLGLPVPQVFLYLEPETKKLLVVDGQQRLRAINAFLKGVYKSREFRLSGLTSEWNGRTFDELGEPDKRRFKNATLRSTIFEQVDPKDNTSIFEVFERLNTGGMSLTAQEVRNAVIGGELNQLIKELNMQPTWMHLIGRKAPEERYRDVELILRLIALENEHQNYKKPMNVFLNTYLSGHKTLDPAKRASVIDSFTKIIKVIDGEIGIDAFKLKKTTNVALADAVYVGIAKNIDNLPNDIKARHRALTNNPDFTDAIGQHTTDTDKVMTRIDLAIKAFRK